MCVNNPDCSPVGIVENAVRANARDIAKHLQSAGPIIAPRVQSGEVKIVVAYYSLDTGQVELLTWSGERNPVRPRKDHMVLM